MFLEFLIMCLSSLLIWDYLYKRRLRAVFKQNFLSGPRSWPVMGCAPTLFQYTPETIFELLSGFSLKCKKTFTTFALHEGIIVTSDAQMMEPLLSSQKLITKNSQYDLLQSWLGDGLLLSTGKKWHQRRRIITPTFHFKILEQFIDIFDQHSGIMARRLHEFADGKTIVDIFPYVCLSALDVVAETAMGVKINAQQDPDFPYVQAVKNTSYATAKRLIRPSQRFDILMALSSPFEYIKLKKSISLMHSFTDKVITNRRIMLQQSIDDGTYVEFDANDDIGSKKRMAFLDVLLQSTVNGSALTNEDIREEVDTFMFEGHDTTTSGISHTLYLLSRHAEVQQKVFEEVRKVLGDDKQKAVNMSELQELKYLECVIKESMRLYPPVPMIGRYVTEDSTINGKLFPKGANILILIYKAGRDEDYFENPDSFMPERFMNDKINPFAYVPFSAGARNCVGQKFAMLQMKSAVSKLIRHFELLPLGEDVKPIMNIILRSATGMQIGLKPRLY